MKSNLEPTNENLRRYSCHCLSEAIIVYPAYTLISHYSYPIKKIKKTCVDVPFYIIHVYIYISWVVGKITYYSQWTWPKRVVPYRLWRFSHKFKHPKSSPYYLSLPRILSLTHIYWNHQIPGCYVARDSAWRASLKLFTASRPRLAMGMPLNVTVVEQMVIWLVVYLPLWEIWVSWDHYSKYIEK